MPKRFINDYLLFQMAILSHKFSAEFYQHLKENKVSPAKWRILLNLSDISGMYITQLADHSCYEQSRVTKLTDQLVNEGFVTKEVSALDRRRVKVKITPSGERLLVPLIDAAKIHERTVLNELSKGDRSQLKSILSTFMKNHIDAIIDPEDAD